MKGGYRCGQISRWKLTAKPKYQNLRRTIEQHTQNVTEFLRLFNTLGRFHAEKVEEALEPDPTYKYRTFMANVRGPHKTGFLRWEYVHKLGTYGNLRNAITHGYGTKDETHLALPLKSTVEDFKKLSGVIMKPPLAWKSIGIPAGKMSTASLGDPLQEVMNGMRKHNYSQETLFMRMVEENGLLLHEDTELTGFLGLSWAGGS